MEILPLEKERIPAAKKLVDRVFPYQTFAEKLNFWVYEHKESWLGRLVLKFAGVRDIMGYWRVMQVGTDEVIGITGLYTYERDAEEAVWLAWFCVAPETRGLGLGSKLLDFTIDRARKTGKSYFRLYTSDDPNEATAQKLYEKKGFKVVKMEEKPFVTIIYREKILRSPTNSL